MYELYKTYDELNSRLHYFYIVVQTPLEEKPEPIAKITNELFPVMINLI